MSDFQKQQSNKVFMMIWGALLYTQVVYVVVVYLKTQDLISFDFESAKLVLPLVVAAVLAGVASFTIPKLLMKNKRAKDYPDALQKAFIPLVLKWILAEAIVIFGLVLSFQNEKNLIIPFFLCALIMFLISFPSQNNIKRMTGLMRL